MRLVGIFSLALLSTCQIHAVAAAQSADPCLANAHTQADINVCAQNRYRAADTSLNDVYKLVLPSLNKAQKEQLRIAQRNWLTFRDTNCNARAFDYKGGSLYESTRNNCLAEVTRARTDELRRVYLQTDATTPHVMGTELLGSWASTQQGYNLKLTFGINNGVHHFLSHLNDLPFEAGQWQVSNGQLSITSSTGEVLHFYEKVFLDNNVLSLHEQDGGVQSFNKVLNTVR